MTFFRSVLSVGAFTILSRLTGFVREMLQAHYIGVSYVSDAVGIAIKIPSLFRRIFAEGALNASFVPLFSRILVTRGKREALNFASTIFSLLAFTLVALTVVVEFFLPDLLPLLFRGLSQTPERLALTLQFSKITFPFLIFISFTAFFGGILNSFERFVAASASPAAGNLFIIFSIIFFTDLLSSPGYALSWGVLGCGVVQFLWVFVPCQFSHIRISLKMPSLTPEVRRFLRVLLPAALGSGVVQINLFLDIMLASYLDVGGISYMNYADRLAQLPLSVIGAAMSTVLLPTLSRALQAGEKNKARELQSEAIKLSLVLAIGPTLALVFMAPSLVLSLYAHGAFQTASIMPTAHTLMALASGLPAYILLKLFSTCFFAHGDTRTPLVVGAAAVILNVILNLALIQSLQYVGLALSTSLSAWAQTVVLGGLLKRRGLLFLKNPSIYMMKMSVLVSTLVFYFLILHPRVDYFLTTAGVSGFLYLPLLLTVPAAAYLIQAYWWQLIPLHFFKKP